MIKKTGEVLANLLSDEWKGREKFGIFHYVTSGGTEVEHKELCDVTRKKLLDENDDKYTSWVFTGEVFKESKTDSLTPFTTVMRFRVRDSY